MAIAMEQNRITVSDPIYTHHVSPHHAIQGTAEDLRAAGVMAVRAGSMPAGIQERAAGAQPDLPGDPRRQDGILPLGGAKNGAGAGPQLPNPRVCFSCGQPDGLPHMPWCEGGQ